MLLMLLDQQVYCFLWDGHSPHRGFGFGPGEGEFAAGIFDVLLADRDRAVLDIKVIPEEGHQLALPKAAHQFQVKHREYPSGIGGVQVGFEMFRPESFHLHLLHLGGNAVISGVAGDEPLLHRPLKGAVEHEVDAADGGTAQTGALILPNVDPSTLHQVFVELLEVAGGQFGELDLTDPRDGIGFDHQLVAVCCGKADVGFGVEVVPGAEPGGYGVLLCTDYVQVFSFFQNLGQFAFDFGLGFAEDIFDDTFAGGGIVAGGSQHHCGAVRSHV